MVSFSITNLVDAKVTNFLSENSFGFLFFYFTTKKPAFINKT